jgi:putative SOS response-associated peptidase YedK
MCGRAKLDGDVSEIKIAFRVPPDYPTPNFAPSWNVAPTDNLPIVRYDPKAGHRTLDLSRHGGHKAGIPRASEVDSGQLYMC